MYYLILCDDKPGCESIRNELRPKRIQWLEHNIGKLLAAGGKVDGENRHVTGGLMIVEADSLEAAEQFAREDPFEAAGLYRNLEVVRWRKVFFDRVRITDPDPFLPDPS
jgi:uncharacterized protein YciI